MKHRKAALTILAAFLASIALADDFKTVNGKEYKDATVSRVEPDGIILKTKSGISKVYFVELTNEVQARFGHDPAKIQAEADAARAVEETRIAKEKTAEREARAAKNLVKTAAATNDPVKTGQKSETAVFFSMLDKNIRSNEIQRWLANTPGRPEISEEFDDGSYYYEFKPKGVSLRFDADDKLDAVFLYSEGAEGYHQYGGALPVGLSFQQTRREIEALLGPPDTHGDDGVINYWVDYTRKRGLSFSVGITYNTKRSDDLSARIYDVSIH